MEDIKNILAFIGSVASVIVSVAACVSLFVKPLRQKIFANNLMNEAEREGIRCLLRDAILKTYYANREKKEIEEYDFENILKLYKAYKALGGNSFVDKIHSEITEHWRVIHTNIGE